MLRARAELLKADGRLTKELQKMPEININIARNKKGFNWYTRESGKRRYIHKAERKLAEGLAQKKMIQAKQQDVRRELAAIEEYLKSMKEEDLEWNHMIEYFQGTGLLQEKKMDIDEAKRQWMEEEYIHNPKYPEKLTIGVGGKLYVRSKSEETIALRLRDHGIPFRYECELVVNGKKFYPDFTIMHPRTGKIIYWEHLGKMDDPAYVKTVYEKLQFYKDNGIVLGDNLIITTEIKDKWFDANYADGIIVHFLQ